MKKRRPVELDNVLLSWPNVAGRLENGEDVAKKLRAPNFTRRVYIETFENT